ncbi:MAG: TPM domain-containing protein [Chitinophagaceae bacterium]|nr:TPM domain-containing protein [Chitinophagaceae bacterium]
MARSLLLILLSAFTLSVNAQLGIPEKARSWTTDLEHILTVEQTNYLDSVLSYFEKESGVQIGILTLDSTQSTPEIFDSLVLAIANRWGVGDPVKQNGIFIGLSASLRKIRICNGQGITGIITDEETADILQKQMIPAFKMGEYFQGLLLGIHYIKIELGFADDH